MLLNIILLILGFAILIKGADIFVDGASSVAQNFKISKMLIGLTIVAFGTSAPEFAVSVTSMINNSGDIVLGNVIGSNILNILLILGIASLFHDLKVQVNTVTKEIPFLILSTILLVVLMNDKFLNGMNNIITRSDGLIILLFFIIFVYYLFSIMSSKQYKEYVEPKFELKKSIIYTCLGIACIILGSNFVVKNASSIASILGISERIIALTIVALGTSLPELVTSVIAAKKGECDIAIGNVVGSNIFNIGIVLGIPITLFGSVNVAAFGIVDIIFFILSAILLYIFSRSGHKIRKKEGIILLMCFVIYYALVII